MKTRTIVTLICAGLLSVVVIAIAGGLWLRNAKERHFGMSSDHPAADYDTRLTAEAKRAVPVIKAVKKYYAEHKTYPANLSQVRGDIPATSMFTPDGGVDGWCFLPAENNNGFFLTRRLGWDPSLTYSWDGTTEKWTFDPGTGDPQKTILLNP